MDTFFPFFRVLKKGGPFPLPVVFGLCLFLCLLPPAFGSGPDSQPSKKIDWKEWGLEAFRQAQDEEKLILLDLTAVWCHACHVMDQTTYSTPAIIEFLNQHFVAIRVDTDQRPDLEARYRAGGWPTTNLLLPTGEVIFQANSLEPGVMENLLHESKRLYETEKDDFHQQAAQLWEQVRQNESIENSTDGILRPGIVAHSVEMMKNQFDRINAGFREQPKFFEPDAIRMAFTYGFFEDDLDLLNMGLQTLDRQVALLDPVWGGFYRYAEFADWSHPHYEKMLALQARNLRNYVEAFQLTGDTEYKYIALRIIDYVQNFLTDNRTGMFFESQDADIRGKRGEVLVRGREYFSEGSVYRKVWGMPRVDQRAFTGSNALMAAAYLQASSVLGDPQLRQFAMKNLKDLFDARFDEKRGLAHSGLGGNSLVFGILSDHNHVGHALVEAYHTTKEPEFLENAIALAQTTQILLEDPRGGGFFDHPRVPDQLGLLKISDKPANENIRAAQFFLRLFHLTENPAFRKIAERTLKSVLGNPQPLPIALIGLAMNEWFRPPVHIAVVGNLADARAQALWWESEQVFCPGKILKNFDPEQENLQWGNIEFPFDGRPAVFMCTDEMCMAPVFEVRHVKDRMKEFIKTLNQS